MQSKESEWLLLNKKRATLQRRQGFAAAGAARHYNNGAVVENGEIAAWGLPRLST